MKSAPLSCLIVWCLLGALLFSLLGLLVIGMILIAAAALAYYRRLEAMRGIPPRPTITYLPQARPDEPLLRLERGQTVTVFWPHPLQVLLPAGTHLQILEATADRVRLRAV